MQKSPSFGLFTILFFSILTTFTNPVYIILHGTWAAETSWYTPGGDFFDALEKTVKKQNGSAVSFRWSGANSIQERNKAAQSLAKLIETYNSDNTDIIVIGHSHGGTVALLASHMLSNNRIAILYTLGTPINKTIYPHMDAIDFCYNLFSFEDLIQPALGMFGREHAPHERIANIRIFINGKEPGHSDMHHELLGTWLPELHTLVTHYGIKLSEPGVIYLDDTKAPVYMLDTTRKELLERDHQLSLLILNSLRKSFEIGSKTPLTNR
jgi:pimeloyl-ACP methyl ester carboxylesterase